MVGVAAPARVVGEHQQGIRVRPFAGEALVVADALLDPVRHRRALGVVGEVLGQVLGEELHLARRRLERVALGVFVEVLEAGGVRVPVRVGGDHVVALLLELLVAHQVLHAGALEPGIDQILDAPPVGVGLEQAQPLGHLADDLVVAERLAAGLDGLLLVHHQVELAAHGVGGDVPAPRTWCWPAG